MCDGRSGLDLIQEQRSNAEPSIKDLIRFRIKAQLISNTDDNVYKVDLEHEAGNLGIRLLRREDPSVDLTDANKYAVYLESYMMNHPTEGIERQPSTPYLKRWARFFVYRGPPDLMSLQEPAGWGAETRGEGDCCVELRSAGAC
jgi:histone deacetylase complex regulatory component SIN3